MTAPGEISGHTRVAGVIGYPARYSLSPAMHNAAYQALGYDAVYLAFPVNHEEVAGAVTALRAMEMMGASVTIPHKEAVIDYLDGLSIAAQVLSAVNCITNTDGKLVGHNTDGEGFVAALRGELSFEPKDKRCVIVGAGGAARAIVAALANAGAQSIVVVNRTQRRAEEAAALAKELGRVGGESDIADADLVINATSVGMTGSDAANDSPIRVDLLNAKQVVVDAVYFPDQTKLLKEASAIGATTANGVGMLLYQAAAQIKLWTGLDAPIDVMRTAADKVRANSTNDN